MTSSMMTNAALHLRLTTDFALTTIEIEASTVPFVDS